MTAARILALGVAAASPAAAAPNVVADVAPIHSIVARVMERVGTPTLLMPLGSSPHDYALHPSDAAALESADLVFWVGDAYTPWLADPIAKLASDAEKIALQDLPDLHLLPVRESGPFRHEAHDEDAHHDEAGNAVDGHIWLDPLNAAAIATAAARSLAQADPPNADVYRANAEAFTQEVNALLDEVGQALAPARGRGYIVFHDAYQYLETRFALPASGSIALHDADQPSAARIAEIRERIRADDIACVFAEPQFPPSLVETAIEGTGARQGSLDPIGNDLEPGPTFYPALIRSLADDLLNCLAAPGNRPTQ